MGNCQKCSAGLWLICTLLSGLEKIEEILPKCHNLDSVKKIIVNLAGNRLRVKCEFEQHKIIKANLYYIHKSTTLKWRLSGSYQQW